MARKTPLVKLDIVGISPKIFHSLRHFLEANQSRDSDRNFLKATGSTVALIDVTKERLELYKKLVSVAVDFERAYRPSCTVRVFTHSSRVRSLVSMVARKQSTDSESKPEFRVNGVKVFVGVPKSFSELDEAIDKTFGHRRETQ
jgi:poly(A) polymerase Pap1